MYIKLVVWENSPANEQQWAPMLQYFTELYSDLAAFQYRDAGEKPYESAARIQTTTIPASRGSVGPPDSSLSGTDRDSVFIAYVKALEDQVGALKDDGTVKTRLTIGSDMGSLEKGQPLAEIIASTSTSDSSAAIISKLHSENNAQKLAMANLTALLASNYSPNPRGRRSQREKWGQRYRKTKKARPKGTEMWGVRKNGLPQGQRMLVKQEELRHQPQLV